MDVQSNYTSKLFHFAIPSNHFQHFAQFSHPSLVHNPHSPPRAPCRAGACPRRRGSAQRWGLSQVCNFTVRTKKYQTCNNPQPPSSAAPCKGARGGLHEGMMFPSEIHHLRSIHHAKHVIFSSYQNNAHRQITVGVGVFIRLPNYEISLWGY